MNGSEKKSAQTYLLAPIDKKADTLKANKTTNLKFENESVSRSEVEGSKSNK